MCRTPASGRPGQVCSPSLVHGWEEAAARVGAICLPLGGDGASFQSDVTTVRTLDGLHLAAALVTTDTSPDRAVVLVYGGGVTREEGGFFTRFGSRAW